METVREVGPTISCLLSWTCPKAHEQCISLGWEKTVGRKSSYFRDQVKGDYWNKKKGQIWNVIGIIIAGIYDFELDSLSRKVRILTVSLKNSWFGCKLELDVLNFRWWRQWWRQYSAVVKTEDCGARLPQYKGRHFLLLSVPVTQSLGAWASPSVICGSWQCLMMKLM